MKHSHDEIQDKNFSFKSICKKETDQMSTSKINMFLLKYYIENEINKGSIEPENVENWLKPFLNSPISKNVDVSKTSDLVNPTLSKKPAKQNTNCEHKSRKHYAKGMCSICYHRAGRTKLAWKCDHKTQPHYAKGCCQTCYLSIYYNEKKKN